ncbi:hypothetical protein HaLaN_25251 [Haematococcus lacustris]|uniref:Uncharacterized protein n=1 Tax=Haematococcus lacustris TaxID=44745 RepID=A0A699ZZW2_HAELA|nr:hypothetical protein HaLaN_25251 [Haematococcus lacustris]
MPIQWPDVKAQRLWTAAVAPEAQALEDGVQEGERQQMYLNLDDTEVDKIDRLAEQLWGADRDGAVEPKLLSLEAGVGGRKNSRCSVLCCTAFQGWAISCLDSLLVSFTAADRQRWSEATVILIPMCPALVAIYPKAKVVMTFDTTHPVHEGLPTKAMLNLTEFLKHAYGEVEWEWKTGKCRQQKDAWSSGTRVLVHMEYLARRGLKQGSCGERQDLLQRQSHAGKTTLATPHPTHGQCVELHGRGSVATSDSRTITDPRPPPEAIVAALRERIAQLESQDEMKGAKIEELMIALLQRQQAKLLSDDGTPKASEQQQPAQPPAHAPLLQQQAPATEKELAEALMSVSRGAPKPRKASCPAAPSSTPRGPATQQTNKRGAPPKPPAKKPKVTWLGHGCGESTSQKARPRARHTDNVRHITSVTFTGNIRQPLDGTQRSWQQ